MILVDSSVWVESFRKKSTKIQALLRENKAQIVTHEMIIGEMMLNNQPQSTFIDDLMLVKCLPTVTLDDYYTFVIKYKIAGQGIGYVDTNLLASCLASGSKILTYDTHLAAAAQKLGCLYQ